MRTVIYNEILSYAEKNISNHFTCLDTICSKYPKIKRSTLFSILNQDIQRKTKKSHHFHTSSRKVLEYYTSYLNDTSNNFFTLLNLAAKVNLSPCLLARIILEKYLSLKSGQAFNKKDVGKFLKEPNLIDDQRLSKNILLCVLADKFYGPVSDTISRSTGHEYEVILRQKLNSFDISFHDENYLRSRGYDVTPDILLQIPIAVKNHVINWIESKALFGDVKCHDKYFLDQYSTYNNRFGPGLVIYWLGYLEELETRQCKDLTIVDNFPEDFVALKVSLR